MPAGMEPQAEQLGQALALLSHLDQLTCDLLILVGGALQAAEYLQ